MQIICPRQESTAPSKVEFSLQFDADDVAVALRSDNAVIELLLLVIELLLFGGKGTLFLGVLGVRQILGVGFVANRPLEDIDKDLVCRGGCMSPEVLRSRPFAVGCASSLLLRVLRGVALFETPATDRKDPFTSKLMYMCS